MNNSNYNNLIVDKHTAKKHKNKLKTLLVSFFDFLSKKPQPTQEEVKTEFLQKEFEWKTYCIQNKLDFRTSMLFNAKVSYEWEHNRMEKSNM